MIQKNWFKVLFVLALLALVGTVAWKHVKVDHLGDAAPTAMMAMAVVVLPGLEKLPNNSKVNGFTHRLSLLRGRDFTTTTANTAQVFSIPIPALSRIQDVMYELTAALCDASDSAFNTNTISVGDSASATTFLSSTQANLYAVTTVADGVTATNTTLTSATMAFVAADVGRRVTGSGIPANTTIVSVESATSVTLSAATTATATGVSITVIGHGTVTIKKMTGSSKVYPVADTLLVTVGSQSSKSISDIDKGEVVIYFNLIQDGQIG